jgi:hypothetical protein
MRASESIAYENPAARRGARSVPLGRSVDGFTKGATLSRPSGWSWEFMNPLCVGVEVRLYLLSDLRIFK